MPRTCARPPSGRPPSCASARRRRANNLRDVTTHREAAGAGRRSRTARPPSCVPRPTARPPSCGSGPASRPSGRWTEARRAATELDGRPPWTTADEHDPVGRSSSSPTPSCSIALRREAAERDGTTSLRHVRRPAPTRSVWSATPRGHAVRGRAAGGQGARPGRQGAVPTPRRQRKELFSNARKNADRVGRRGPASTPRSRSPTP